MNFFMLIYNFDHGKVKTLFIKKTNPYFVKTDYMYFPVMINKR